jgi:hypothetical protein
MRNQWYGDKRDIIKWGVLLELARRYRSEHILQVLYYRPSSFGPLNINGELCVVPEAVLHHFRRVTAVSAIECNARVELIDELFEARAPYLNLVLRRIHARPALSGIVFLDPDTGLAPAANKRRKLGLQHVLETELKAIWTELRKDDLLVFYQHQTNRKGAPWISDKKAQFERAIGLSNGAAQTAKAPSIAKDVVFFFVRKG